jgi:putative endonuclease
VTADRGRVARGRWAEQRAAAHLARLGFEIVARNWRPHGVGVRGDLDVIAEHDDLVVVCEVKARRVDAPGGAVGAVTPTKQAQIRALTELWLVERSSPDVRVRFDVITIDGVRLTHWEHAF